MIAAVLPVAILPRLGQLIRLLGSDRDGEVVAAARALKRTLTSAGSDMHGLADAIEHPPVPVVIERAPPARRRAPTGSRTYGDRVQIGSTQRRDLTEGLRRALDGHGPGLTAWEVDFARSILIDLRDARPCLSIRQVTVAERIIARTGGR